MLRTNTNKVKENVTNYIMEHAADIIEEYEAREEYALAPTLFCRFMNSTFYDEILKHNKAYQARPYSSEYSFFEQWAKGLGFCGMFDYYLYANDAPKNLVAEWLEETEEEKNKYTNDEAAALATKLIYNTMKKHAQRYIEA